MNKEARPFEEYKEMIQDMSKDNMIKGLYDLSANIIEKDKEIERLNNIIDEIEKYIKHTSSGIITRDDIVDVNITGNLLKRIKELKEGK